MGQGNAFVVDSNGRIIAHEDSWYVLSEINPIVEAESGHYGLLSVR